MTSSNVKGRSFELRVHAGAAHVVDSYVLDRVSAARTVSEVEVDGVPAVLSAYETGDRLSLIWAMTPALMAEIDSIDMTAAEILAVAQSVRPAGNDECSTARADPALAAAHRRRPRPHRAETDPVRGP